jgi:hypothetical protein
MMGLEYTNQVRESHHVWVCEAASIELTPLFLPQCFCGDSFQNGGGLAIKENECNMPCAGNRSETCGGTYTFSYFIKNPNAPVKQRSFVETVRASISSLSFF